MPLYEVIQTTPAIQAGARRLASILHASNPKQRPTSDERMKWYRFTPSVAWAEDFSIQLKEVQKIVCIWKMRASALY